MVWAQAVVALRNRQPVLLRDDEDHGLLVAVGPRDGREGLHRREAEGREEVVDLVEGGRVLRELALLDVQVVRRGEGPEVVGVVLVRGFDRAGGRGRRGSRGWRRR